MKIDTGTWKDWEVYIETSGVPLPEYQITRVLTRLDSTGGCIEVECFVEIEDNLNFSIVTYRPAPGTFDASVRWTVDDRCVGKNSYPADMTYPAKKRGQYERVDGELYTRDFVFKAANLVDLDLDLNQQQQQRDPNTDSTSLHLTTGGLGTINVVLIAGKLAQEMLSDGAVRRKRTVHSPLPVVGEKAKHAAETYVGGELKPSPDDTTRTVRYRLVKDPALPRCHVTVKYGTRSTLLALGVIDETTPPLFIPNNAAKLGQSKRSKKRSASMVIDMDEGPGEDGGPRNICDMSKTQRSGVWGKDGEQRAPLVEKRQKVEAAVPVVTVVKKEEDEDVKGLNSVLMGLSLGAVVE